MLRVLRPQSQGVRNLCAEPVRYGLIELSGIVVCRFVETSATTLACLETGLGFNYSVENSTNSFPVRY
jgi:hypothetical protein